MQNTVNISYVNSKSKDIYDQGLQYATIGSLGLDLRACIEQDITIKAGERIAINTGIRIEILKEDVGAFIYSRSGLGAKQGIVVAQGVGVIDKDYRGEIIVVLLNTSDNDYTIIKGERIAQMLFQQAYQLKVIETDILNETERGSGGFGHSGKI